jgi:hypothetical protein
VERGTLLLTRISSFRFQMCGLPGCAPHRWSVSTWTNFEARGWEKERGPQYCQLHVCNASGFDLISADCCCRPCARVFRIFFPSLKTLIQPVLRFELALLSCIMLHHCQHLWPYSLHRSLKHAFFATLRLWRHCGTWILQGNWTLSGGPILYRALLGTGYPRLAINWDESPDLVRVIFPLIYAANGGSCSCTFVLYIPQKGLE